MFDRVQIRQWVADELWVHVQTIKRARGRAEKTGKRYIKPSFQAITVPAPHRNLLCTWLGGDEWLVPGPVDSNGKCTMRRKTKKGVWRWTDFKGRKRFGRISQMDETTLTVTTDYGELVTDHRERFRAAPE